MRRFVIDYRFAIILIVGVLLLAANLLIPRPHRDEPAPVNFGGAEWDCTALQVEPYSNRDLETTHRVCVQYTRRSAPARTLSQPE